MDKFDACWDGIVTKLHPMPKMYSWSKAGRARTSFGIVEVKPSAIIVRTSRGLRRVSRSDFQVIYPLWPDYKSGNIERHKLRGVCHNTVYVLAILHWFELQ